MIVKHLFICVLMMCLGSGLASLTPDAAIQMSIDLPPQQTYGSAINECLASTQLTSSKNVRLQEFSTPTGTTFVRHVLSDAFSACYADLGTVLPASNFYACSVETENAGLKMFSFTESDSTCTGYPMGIPVLRQGCMNSGSKVFYETVEATARANHLTEVERLPAIKKQATLRVGPLMPDVIDEFDGFKGIEGKGLTSLQAYQEFEVLNRCQCHQFCSTSFDCKAYSARELGPNRVLCSLANENVYSNTPSSMDDSYYAVRAELVEELAFDNLIYRRLDDTADGFDAHKAACEAIPGFQLISVRFQEQMPLLLNLCLGRPPNIPNEDCPNTYQEGWFFVDMVKGFDELLIRNEIPLSQTNLLDETVLVNDDATHNVFVYAHSLQLHDETMDRLNTRPVCQANIFGVDW